MNCLSPHYLQWLRVPATLYLLHCKKYKKISIKRFSQLRCRFRDPSE